MSADDDIWLCIGAVIRAARVAHGRSQADLAQAAGVSRMSVTKVENGDQAMSLGLLYRLAGELRVGPADLFPTDIAAAREQAMVERQRRADALLARNRSDQERIDKRNQRAAGMLISETLRMGER